MTVNFTKGKFNLREKLKELERPSVDKLVTKDENGAYIDTVRGNTKLESIDTIISDTAVDIFIYDTSKDSDGGAWRKRTQHTSWYNETLNTATRGSRREFPAVAVIVATADDVLIYDGDDPDMPLWMKFIGSGNARAVRQGMSSITMLNGLMTAGRSGSERAVGFVNFVSDYVYQIANNGKYEFGTGGIINRNTDGSYINVSSGTQIVNNTVNDVAMTVLPNAPIDPTTGLPIPTIAVATNGGVSVIKDDGTVVDLTCSQNSYNNTLTVAFNENNDLIYDGFNGNANADGKAIRIDEIPSTDKVVTTIASQLQNSKRVFLYGDWYNNGTGTALGTSVSKGGKFIAPTNDSTDINFGESIGVSKVKLGNSNNNLDALVCGISSSCNTGWMHGNIKGAFLSDTDATNVTGTELITNGTFDTDTTGWTRANGATLTQENNGNPGGNINVASDTTSNGYAYQSNTVVVGKYYTLTFDHYHVNGSEGYVNIGTTTGADQYVYQPLGTSSSWTRYSFTIKATSTNLFTGFYSKPNGNVRYDNISLREADPDRSVNAKGLQVFGTINKSPVATGAELVAYSGFSDSNYLQQPYNSDLDFGTSDFSITVWVKPGITGNQQSIVNFLSQDSGGATEDGFYLVHYNDATGNWYFGTYENGAVQYTSLSLGSLTSTNKWYCLHVNKIGATAHLYQDGREIGSGAVKPDITINSADVSRASLRIGRANAGGLGFGGSIALLRISDSTPSPEQIKKIYEDEKVLFQENAACTLYGSSDAVTALAYDEVTERLHVGTSSGRSEFQGLRRINNTTTAVTTAISAYDSFVVEQ
jgi:hypothetical protein